MLRIILSWAHSCWHGYWQRLSQYFNKKTKRKKRRQFPGRSLGSRCGGRGLVVTASQCVIQLKLLLTSSYVKMWLITQGLELLRGRSLLTDSSVQADLKWESRGSSIRASWQSAAATWLRLTEEGLFWWGDLLASAHFCLITTHLPTFIPAPPPLIWQLGHRQGLGTTGTGYYRPTSPAFIF